MTSEDDMLWSFIFTLTDFTDRRVHYVFAVEVRTTLDPFLQKPDEELHSWRMRSKVRHPNKQF
jgi:hypothetical protein